MRIIFESLLMLFTKNYQNCSMFVETTACQSLLVFWDTVYMYVLLSHNNKIIISLFDDCVSFPLQCQTLASPAIMGHWRRVPPRSLRMYTSLATLIFPVYYIYVEISVISAWFCEDARRVVPPCAKSWLRHCCLATPLQCQVDHRPQFTIVAVIARIPIRHNEGPNPNPNPNPNANPLAAPLYGGPVLRLLVGCSEAYWSGRWQLRS